MIYMLKDDLTKMSFIIVYYDQSYIKIYILLYSKISIYFNVKML